MEILAIIGAVFVLFVCVILLLVLGGVIKWEIKNDGKRIAGSEDKDEGSA